MSIEGNKVVTRQFYDEVLNAGDMSTLEDIAVDDYQENDPLPGQTTGRRGLEQRVTMLRTALTPHFTIEDMVAEGDRVVVRWTHSGTHVADFLGIPATGRHFTIAGIDIHRLQDGRLAEHWHVVDQLSMLGQLGLLPESQEAATTVS